MNVSTSPVQLLDIDNSFENETLSPWTDCSEDGAEWIIGNMSSSRIERNEKEISPPIVESGAHYLWLQHDLETFGIGILISPTFLAFPGDEIKFSFWIHSSFKHFNNIQASIDFVLQKKHIITNTYHKICPLQTLKLITTYRPKTGVLVGNRRKRR